MGLHCNCRFGQRGRIHLHIQGFCFIFPFHIPVFSFSPCPATSLQCWTGNISCLPPAVTNHLLNTTTDADSSAWCLGKMLYLETESSSPPGEVQKPFRRDGEEQRLGSVAQCHRALSQTTQLPSRACCKKITPNWASVSADESAWHLDHRCGYCHGALVPFSFSPEFATSPADVVEWWVIEIKLFLQVSYASLRWGFGAMLVTGNQSLTILTSFADACIRMYWCDAADQKLSQKAEQCGHDSHLR